MHPFAAALLAWSKHLNRPMPWRGERDPYRIWLSEIILQQTRVAQGTAYYLRFLEAYPHVEDLAAAHEDDVLALWQGLGYYSRARNLHKAAAIIAKRGAFPETYQELLTLPGVGPYTAAAIASFAYDEPVAVIDGNVYRVLARYFGLEAPIDKPAGKRAFAELAAEALPAKQPAAYNQAIMDFGATVCTPKSPACLQCPLQSSCTAYAEGRVHQLPLKLGKTKRRARYLNYIHLVDRSGRLFLGRRGAGDIWQGLYDLPVLETPTSFAEQTRIAQWLEMSGLQALGTLRQALPRKHVLSHQDLYVRYWEVSVEPPAAWSMPPECTSLTHLRWIKLDEVLTMGIPRLLERYLTEPEATLDFGATV